MVIWASATYMLSCVEQNDLLQIPRFCKSSTICFNKMKGRCFDIFVNSRSLPNCKLIATRLTLVQLLWSLLIVHVFSNTRKSLCLSKNDIIKKQRWAYELKKMTTPISAISQSLSIKYMHSIQLRHDCSMNGVTCANFSCRPQLKGIKGKRKNKSQTI